MNISKFMISEDQYIKIYTECIHEDDCPFCINVDINYIDEKNNICIRFGYDTIASFCSSIASEHTQKLLNNQLILDKSIIGDPGIEWNKYFEGLIKNTEIDQFHCWSNSHKKIRPYFSSWMYNDKEGNVVFEITPFYPWHGEKKSSPGFITYKEFMKNYKPVLVTNIPKENLKTWIDQARELQKQYFPEFEKV
jgi:hypothetical protein